MYKYISTHSDKREDMVLWNISKTIPVPNSHRLGGIFISNCTAAKLIAMPY